jgi:hypothetical protein
MSARETPELLLLVVRLVQAEGYDGQLSPIPMGRSATSPVPISTPESIGNRGVSSDHTWHGNANHQGT